MIKTLCLSFLTLLPLACGEKKDSNPAPVVEDKSITLESSKAKWEQTKLQKNTYTYKVTFLEDTGKPNDGAYLTVVGVKDGKLACRSYWHSNGDSYIEGESELNSHKDKGASARTIDNLYQQCSQGLALNKNSFYLHYGTEGILLGCNNSCLNNCDIDEIPFSDPIWGEADCNKKVK